MIERHVTFATAGAAEFECFCAEDYLPAMSAMPGFVGVSLLRDQDRPSDYHMVIRFESAESAAVWRASPAHAMLKPRMSELCTSKELRVYDVVH